MLREQVRAPYSSRTLHTKDSVTAPTLVQRAQTAECSGWLAHDEPWHLLHTGDFREVVAGYYKGLFCDYFKGPSFALSFCSPQ